MDDYDDDDKGDKGDQGKKKPPFGKGKPMDDDDRERQERTGDELATLAGAKCKDKSCD